MGLQDLIKSSGVVKKFIDKKQMEFEVKQEIEEAEKQSYKRNFRNKYMREKIEKGNRGAKLSLQTLREQNAKKRKQYRKW